MTRTCSIDGCDKPHRARGWCSRHWTHWRRYGEPIAPGVVDTATATRRQAEIAERRRQERFEDARDLMAGGVHPDWIPARLGCTRDALAIQARRHGAPDIYEWAKPAERTKPCPDCGCDIRKASTRCTDCALVARWVKGAA